ncbi:MULTISPECIES: carboxylate-amine ligase [Actinokineospora]|uniref:Putative glutamate--cysteine ligase 2 n=1 Tax=Actinokineospora fastidiosa TaxID=1816 RepID=A0A918LI94_9PSEU|nr:MULTISPECIES: glutamate--cysteine ligase [Actinokineospora]UVS78495.1 Carboxylate-amine ligase YbdK [Actinokineospora sp. UTMC 2448]GGS55190.1 putative glutamate--cysteine ligase 2 [Actinokineospora fastidiosa]
MDRPSLGVEEEFVLVDGDGHLVQAAPEILAESADRGLDLKAELLRCQVESATGVHTDVDALRADIARSRAALIEAAAGRGLRLLATGTPVLGEEFDALLGPDTRYRRIHSRFGSMVFSGLTCGSHVHVEVADREVAVQVVNHLRPWLPVLLAISANSPFNDGRDTGYASSRHLLWSRWPTAVPPPYLDSAADYDTRVRALVDTTAAMDLKMVYWEVRISDHLPTIEVRVADVLPTADEAALFGVLVRALVTEFIDLVARALRAQPVPQDILRGRLWRAARDGLAGQCADPVTGHLRPTLAVADDLIARLDDPAERALAARVRARWHSAGGGAERQRRAYAESNSLDGVIDHIVRETAQGV